MLYNVRIVQIIVYFILFVKVTAERNFNIEIYDVRVVYRTHIFKAYYGGLVKLESGNFAISGGAKADRDLGKNMRMRFILDLQRSVRNITQHIRLLDLNMRICDFWENPFAVNLLKPFVKEIRRSSNFPVCCALEADVWYNLDNFILSADLLPPYVPTLNFTVTLKLYEMETLFVVLNVEGGTFPKPRKGLAVRVKA